MYVKYILSRKSSGNFYQNIYKSDFFEFCGIMEGADVNPFVKTIINTLNDTAPQLFHKCPYEGEIEVINATILGEKAFLLFPTATYCAELLIFDNKKKQFLSSKTIVDIKNGIDVLNLDLLKN